MNLLENQLLSTTIQKLCTEQNIQAVVPALPSCFLFKSQDTMYNNVTSRKISQPFIIVTDNNATMQLKQTTFMLYPEHLYDVIALHVFVKYSMNIQPFIFIAVQERIVFLISTNNIQLSFIWLMQFSLVFCILPFVTDSLQHPLPCSENVEIQQTEQGHPLYIPDKVFSPSFPRWLSQFQEYNVHVFLDSPRGKFS